MTAGHLFSPPPAVWGKAAEKAYQDTLIDPRDGLLIILGYATNHCYPLQTKHGWRTGTTAKGWPDIIAVRQHFVLAVEVKGFDVKGRPTPFQPGQVEWLELFAEIPTGRAWVLRPTDDWDQTVQWCRHPEDGPRRFGYDPILDRVSPIGTSTRR